MKRTLSLVILFGGFLTVKAQKGDNLLQLSGQANFPISNLADNAKTGYGFAAKGMYGIGTGQDHVTLEAGYNRFAIKESIKGLEGFYSAIPIYTGYRYTIGNFNLEPQAGIAFNKIAVSTGSAENSSSKTSFAWSTSVSYALKSLELGVRYQSSEIKDKDNLTFLGIRLAYNFSL